MKDYIKSTLLGGIQLGATCFVGVMTYHLLAGALDGVQKTINDKAADKKGAKD